MKVRSLLYETPLRTLLSVAIFSRLFVFAVAWLANLVLGVNPACLRCGDIGVPFLNLFSRWDSTYYADIAIRGYPNVITQRWEFFPLYPIVMGIIGRSLAIVPGISLTVGVYVAGFAVSNLAFLGSVYFFYKFSDRVLSKSKLAFDSAFFLAIYPAGIFLSAAYSESLFLLLTLCSLYYWQSGGVAESAVSGFLATLTRPVGVFLTVPFLYEALASPARRKRFSSYIPVVGAVLGFLVFMAYSQFMTGTPFANFAAEREFWNVTANPETMMLLAQKELLNHPIIIPFLALGILPVVASLLAAENRTEKSIGVYAVCLVVAYVVTPIISFPRYSMTLLPIYWTFSRWSQVLWVKVLLSLMFLALLAVGAALYVNWYSFY
jgi:Gpi18-like mannosyltransferase